METYKHTDETKKKISLALKGKLIKEKNGMYGKKHSKETLEKLSKIHKGIKFSEEHKRKLGEAQKGKHHSEETKLKMSLARKGRIFTEEWKKNLGLAHKGEKNHRWKGKIIKKDGYVMVNLPNHPNASKQGYVAEHRLVMEEFLGRYLSLDEVVHHINKNTSDNRIENLMLFANDSEHKKYHYQIKYVK